MRTTEFTYNPEVILQSEFDSNLLEFNGIGIGQDLSQLPTESVSEFYDKQGESQNTDIKNGWVLTMNGIQYVLKNGIVKMIRVKKNGITKLNRFDKDDVEKLLGKPNKITEDSITWVWDNVVYAKVYHYKKRKTKIHFSTKNGKLCELEIK
ncbi:hypothetical protein [Mesonia aestuariivivens]|uniref:Beta-lactamase-inhibitor-like PepSY-like domain-containing protein n=1 Tax=Mesonia aestuariivivens TaxID=2796128 RepID=A0ABS6VZ63_9FLAO|nr:hypothetical protein [Mesonia aestuariivivens]MBW2960551.1 hypothetical protein [Mesonia aestuariivivens]